MPPPPLWRAPPRRRPDPRISRQRPDRPTSPTKLTRGRIPPRAVFSHEKREFPRPHGVKCAVHAYSAATSTLRSNAPSWGPYGHTTTTTRPTFSPANISSMGNVVCHVSEERLRSLFADPKTALLDRYGLSKRSVSIDASAPSIAPTSRSVLSR